MSVNGCGGSGGAEVGGGDVGGGGRVDVDVDVEQGEVAVDGFAVERETLGVLESAANCPKLQSGTERGSASQWRE